MQISSSPLYTQHSKKVEKKTNYFGERVQSSAWAVGRAAVYRLYSVVWTGLRTQRVCYFGEYKYYFITEYTNT